MLITDTSNAMLYFWNTSCSVCSPLYDKIETLMKEKYPLLELQKFNIEDHPELRSKYNVFSSPFIILLLDGKEYLRFSGNVSMHELSQRIDRLYKLRFG